MKQVELIEKRKPREKHFLQEDGTIIAEVYPTNIHYLKDGKYQEIDNTLINENGILKNKSNDYKVEFKENFKESLMKMTKDNHYIDFKVREANIGNIKATKRTLSKKMKNTISNNINDDITVEYQALSDKVKETIVLQNANYSKLSFELDTDLILSEEEGEIIARDINKTIIFRIEKPYMIDSNKIRNDNVLYKITSFDDAYLLTLVLDDEWLNSSEIKFPVYVDPTITNIGKENNVYDTYIFPGDTGIEKHNKEFLKAGVEKINNNNVANRTLIKFELPEIGTGSNIVAARLELVPYPTTTEYPTEKIATIHRITADWDEASAIWDNMYDKFDSHVENIYYTQRSTISNNMIVPGFISDGDITSLVKKWYRETPNYGVMIKAANEENYVDNDFPMFYSKENNALGDYNPKPIFYLIYRNQNGIENYLDYKIQSFSKGKAYVNTNNGNLTTTFNVGHTVGGKLPINLEIVYNTNDVILENTGKYGVGYKLNFEQTLKEASIDSKYYLEYLDEDGTIHYLYKEESSDIYKDAEGLNLTVSKSNNIYTMSDAVGTELIFTKSDDKYYLTKLIDKNNNFIEIILNSDNSINKLTDKFGSEITVAYNADNIIVNSPSSVTQLNYSDGLLISIKNEQGITSFTYNDKKIISSITDITGLKISYEYYNKSPYKVKKVVQYGLNEELGQYYLLEYGYDITRITDNKGRIETIIYNCTGNVESRNSMKSNEDIENAYSIVQNVGTSDLSNKNKILSNVIPMKYIKNYLKNTSFEQEIENFIYNDGITKTFTTEEYNSGYRSLKVTSTCESQSFEQTINIMKGKYYTFSGYFKNSNSVIIALSYTDANNNEVISYKELDLSESFIRDDVTIYYSEDATSDLKIKITLVEIGTLYIDDLQLEEGEVANGYNVIENSDFSEGYSDWTVEGWTFDGSQIEPNNYYNIVKFNNEKNTALKISMNPLIGTMIYKEYPIKGKKDDLYTISFWYKNEGIPNYADLIRNSITIYFKPVNGEAEYCILSSTGFNINENVWQYFTFRSRAIEDYESIKIIFSNGRQANDLYITNLAFYKEVTSGDYQYDNNGNLISSTDQSKNENIFEYTKNNRLVSASNSTGAQFSYEYDKEDNSKIINTLSSLGISNATLYDNTGNVINTRFSKRVVTAEITPGVYKIRSKGTKKYIKSELNIALLEENECSNTLWKLELVNDKYKICYSLCPNYSISCNNGEISIDTGNVNNLFDLKKNNDGSYRISFIEETLEGDIIWFLKAKSNNLLEAKTYEEGNSDYDFYIESQEEIFEEQAAQYTEDGRYLVSIMDSNFNEIKYGVNLTSGLIEKVTLQNGVSVDYTYNEKGFLSSIKNNNKEIKYEYNNNNLINKVIQNNKKYQIHYDNFLNPIKTTLNDDITFITNTYLPNNGKIIITTFGNGDSISYGYDEFDRIKSINKKNDIYSYKYDNNGNLSKIISDNAEVRYFYDKSNRLYKYKCNDLIADFTYDNDSDIISKAYKMKENNHSQTNIFENGMLISVEDDGTSIGYEYDKLNRKIGKNVNNLYTITCKYLAHGKRATDLIETYVINDNKYKYEYDKLGNICNIYYNNTHQKHYEYDIYGELIKEINYDLNIEANYMYDIMGNMLKKNIKFIDSGTNRNYIYNYENPNWEDQLTKFDGYEIEYDAIGNPTKINTANLTWENGRELKSYIDNNLNIQATYTYDLNGIRKSKNVGGIETRYHVVGNNIVYEESGNRVIYYLYDIDGVIGLECNGSRYYYIKNLQNDVTGIVDENGNQLVKYQYDSWGKIWKIEDINGNAINDSSHIGILNPFRYRSYYYDNETGLYYLNNRYYNPEWCRFINADSSIGVNQDFFANNLYLYVSNNPINNTDINGQSIKSMIEWCGRQWEKAKKGLKKLKKDLEKVFNIQASYTKSNTLDFETFVARTFAFDCSKDAGFTSSQNIVGNESAPVTVSLNTSNLLESSVSVQFNTSIGTFAIGKGKGSQTFRYESPTDGEDTRTVIEGGSNFYSAYFLKGTVTDLESGYIKFDYNRLSISKLMIILIATTIGPYGVMVAAQEVIPALTNAFTQ